MCSQNLYRRKKSSGKGNIYYNITNRDFFFKGWRKGGRRREEEKEKIRERMRIHFDSTNVYTHIFLKLKFSVLDNGRPGLKKYF